MCLLNFYGTGTKFMSMRKVMTVSRKSGRYANVDLAHVPQIRD